MADQESSIKNNSLLRKLIIHQVIGLLMYVVFRVTVMAYVVEADMDIMNAVLVNIVSIVVFLYLSNMAMIIHIWHSSRGSKAEST